MKERDGLKIGNAFNCAIASFSYNELVLLITKMKTTASKATS